eukprot:sb/3478491/
MYVKESKRPHRKPGKEPKIKLVFRVPVQKTKVSHIVHHQGGHDYKVCIQPYRQHAAVLLPAPNHQVLCPLQLLTSNDCHGFTPMTTALIKSNQINHQVSI